MTMPTTRSGGRRPKSAKARNRGMWGTVGAAGYGDLAAGSGAWVLQRGGWETGFASLEARELRRDRAAGILPEVILSLWVSITEQFCMARQASPLSAESQHG